MRSNRPETRPERVGVLLVNLGTPDACDARSVRVYLKEFLSDRRVIEDQGLVWQAILNGIILRVRPARKALDYRKIWNVEKDESPLKTVTRSQAKSSPPISPTTSTWWWTGRCVTATPRSAPASMRWRGRAAAGSWWCRSIRNIRPRPRRPSATRCFACSPTCARSRSCG
jgi:hypothetical protein